MKEFIYLDTAFLHSFIAQKNNGLPNLHSTEFQESETKTSTDGTTKDVVNEVQADVSSGTVKIPFVVDSPSGKLSYKMNHKRGITSGISWTQLEAGKEIISKQLHDNALQLFEDYLEENNLIKRVTTKTEDFVSGDYLLIQGAFSIISVNNIKDVLNPDAIPIALEMAFEQQVQAKINVINNSTLADSIKKKQINELKNNIKSSSKEISDTLGMFRVLVEYLESLLPSSVLLKISNFVCPLKIEFLRETPKELSFKYNNADIKVTILGKYTKDFVNFNELSTNNLDGPFGKLGDAINTFDEVFEKLGILKKGEKIISPVAIYFE